MTRLLLTLIIFCSTLGLAFGQSNGDYRSAQTGPWIQTATWQVFVNGAWRDLGSASAGAYRKVIPSSSSGQISIRHAVTLGRNLTANGLLVESGGSLIVSNGIILSIQGDGVTTPLQIDAGGSLTNSGTLQVQASGLPCHVYGVLSSSNIIQTSNPAMLIFHPGAQYRHGNKSGGNIPLATWDTNSTCYITGMSTTTSAKPGNLGQQFGNFVWNTPSMVSTQYSLDGLLTSVTNELRIVSTGSGSLRLGYTGPGINVTIGGDLVVQGGALILAQNQTSTSSITINGNLRIESGTLITGNNNAATNVFLKGNFIKTGGSITRGTGSGLAIIRFTGGVHTYQNNSDITSAISFSVENGSTLDLGDTYLSGTGAFVMANGSTLRVSSVHPLGALQLGNTGGNIRMTGARTYQPGSTIIYDGPGLQYLGNGHPAPSHTILDNGVGATMVSNVAINGNLTLGDNNLSIESNTLTLGGNLFRGDGALGVSSNSSIVINGNGDFGDLVLYFTEAANNPMRDLTINRSGGTVYLGSSLTVGGNFSLQNGNFSLGQFSAYTLTLRGNFSQSASATLSVYDNSRLVIEGAGTLPTNVRITGPNLFELTMDRPSSTFNTTSPLTLTRLNLFNGTVNNSALTIVMANGGLVTRHSGGSITSVLGVPEPGMSFDVLYDVNNDITTGNELPFTDEAGITRLRHLTKTGTATVNLNHPIQVNGNFTIEEGTFHLGSDNDAAIGQDLTVAGQLLTNNSAISFVGSGPQTIDATKLELYELEVDQTVGSTVTLTESTLIDVSTRLAVMSNSTLEAGNNQVTLLSSADGTANVAPIAAGGSITGSVIVQRFLPKAVQRAEYFHLASPVTNATFAQWTDDVSIRNINVWNEPAADYVKVSTTSAIQNGRGYIVDIRNTTTATLQLSGPLKQGDAPVSVTTRTPGVEAGAYGWNVIGNPYPSAIDWDNVAINESQVYNAIYMWDNYGNSGQGTGVGISVSYVDGVGIPASFHGEIAQGQAFWVKALQNATIPFTENAKIPATTTTVFREKEIPNVLRIAINGSGVKDEAVVRLREGATANFDGHYDAYKFMPEGFSLSTLTGDNVKASINAFGPSACNSNIPLIAEGAKQGSFTLDFSGMESFDPSVTLALVDLVANKRIDIRNQQSYTFAVTDENIDLTERRFELVIGNNLAAINTEILARGEALCEDEEFAKITLETSELGVEYVADFNGIKLSEPVAGTGSSIDILVRTSSLLAGENKVTVMASSGVCSMTALHERPTINRVQKGKITDATPGVICTSGSATLKVSGAASQGWYAWYESEDALEPIPGNTDGTFVTPNLTKTTTYYVAAVNALGCEGVRTPIKAVVSFPEQVELTTDGDGYLVSSVEEGLKWYLDGVLLENESSPILAPVESGTYTVEVTNGGCKTSAEMEVKGLGETGIVLYPNPTADKLWIRVRSANNTVRATLINAQGIEVGTKDFIGNGDLKEAEFDLLHYAPGMYHVRIQDGGKVINKKIAKVD